MSKGIVALAALSVSSAAILYAIARLYCPKSKFFKKKEGKKPFVVFVLGGPGAGKGTQCSKLVVDYEFVHLSAGDLLREEQAREGSKYGDLISTYIKEGKVVPGHITISLLKSKIEQACCEGKYRFLIDGFPRALDQGLDFEKEICESSLVLFYECDEQVMLKRLLKRGESSGRIDDNVDSIKKRFDTFWKTSLPVVEHYEKTGKVKRIDCTRTVEQVSQETSQIIQDLLNKVV